MIKLKILAAVFSVGVAVTEEWNFLFSEPEVPTVEESITIETPPIIAEPVAVTSPVPTTTYNVSATIYFPEPGQTDSTPFITADGSRINKKNPKKHRWVAVSRNLHSRWGGELSFGDSLMVSGVSDDLDGIYVVRDIMNRRMKNKIDILVGRNDKIMGLWHDVHLAKL